MQQHTHLAVSTKHSSYTPHITQVYQLSFRTDCLTRLLFFHLLDFCNTLLFIWHSIFILHCILFIYIYKRSCTITKSDKFSNIPFGAFILHTDTHTVCFMFYICFNMFLFSRTLTITLSFSPICTTNYINAIPYSYYICTTITFTYKIRTDL